MKIKIKKRHIILAAVNVLCLAGFLTLILIGSAQGKSQTYNYACRRWAGEDSEDYSQSRILVSLQDVSAVSGVRFWILFKQFPLCLKKDRSFVPMLTAPL